MGISSNSIIHFTRTKTALQGILKDNFKLKYCCEVIKLGTEELTVGVPMVSFCDIPLSQIKDHIGKYGNYGIGLTKEWAARKMLNPVIYLQTGSMLSKSLRHVLLKYRNESPKLSDKDEALLDILRYSKNHENNLRRLGKKAINNYRFYDEREWRYVPPAVGNSLVILGSNSISNPEKRNAANAKLTNHRLVFEPDDIRYIIIKDETEIGDFLNVLKLAKGKNYPAHAIERLSTRILTAAQIMTDF